MTQACRGRYTNCQHQMWSLWTLAVCQQNHAFHPNPAEPGAVASGPPLPAPHSRAAHGLRAHTQDPQEADMFCSPGFTSMYHMPAEETVQEAHASRKAQSRADRLSGHLQEDTGAKAMGHARGCVWGQTRRPPCCGFLRQPGRSRVCGREVGASSRGPVRRAAKAAWPPGLLTRGVLLAVPR